LQGFDLGGVAIVFALQAVDLFLELLILGALLTVYLHSVGSEHDVNEEPSGKQGYGSCRQATAGGVEPSQVRTQPVRQLLDPCFGLWGALDQGAQAILGAGQDANFRRLLYSK